MSTSRTKIVIGIPSYNEEGTIGHVTKQVDLGLRKYYPYSKSLIINVDSNSTDNTREAFLKTTTFFPKKYLNTGKKFRGKGKNLIELFKFCNNSDINFIALLDSDIKTVKPDWVFSLLNPLMTEEFDYTTPAYSRGCYDGNVTNNFAIPLTYAAFGVTLQQPIGGEFGLNERFYKYLLKKPTNKAVLGFGIDIFMT
ncbi:MAG: glycosyltransferase, partial [Microgenomates group bacterium]